MECSAIGVTVKKVKPSWLLGVHLGRRRGCSIEGGCLGADRTSAIVATRNLKSDYFSRFAYGDA